MHKTQRTAEERTELVRKIDELREGGMGPDEAAVQCGVKPATYYSWKNPAKRTIKKNTGIKRVDLNEVLPHANTPSQPEPSPDIVVTVLQGNPKSIGETLGKLFGGNR